MKENQYDAIDGKRMRREHPNSFFLDEIYDKAIVGIQKNGAVMYNHFELLYLIMDLQKDKFNGDDYEREKAEFSDSFSEFYDLVNEQMQVYFIDSYILYQTGQEVLIPPILTPAALNPEYEEHTASNEFVFPADISYIIRSLAEDDISDLFGFGVQEILDEDEWLSLISESKNVAEEIFVKPDNEMAITIKAIEMITGFDYLRILWNGVNYIINDLIQSGELADLEEFGTKRELAKNLI